MCRCVVGAAVALSGHEGSGGRDPMGKGSDNQHVVGGCMWQGAGIEGGTAFIMAARSGNNIPCTSRSATAAFFARMEVVMRWQGGGCGNKGNENGGGDVVELAFMRAGVGRRNESRQGEAWTR